MCSICHRTTAPHAAPIFSPQAIRRCGVHSKVRPMRRRHVVRVRGVGALACAVPVASDALLPGERLDGLCRHAQLDLGANKPMRHAVEVAVVLDVVVDIHAGRLEARNHHRVGANGRSAGRSSNANALARMPGSFLNGRAFKSESNAAIAVFSSAR